MTTLIDEYTKISYKYYKDDPNTEKVQAVVEYLVDGEVYTIVSIPFETVTEAAACGRWIQEQAFALVMAPLKEALADPLTPSDFAQKGGVKIPIH